jgi:uncharacterized SAM-binding protein YcdF (DUF218 family)
MKKKSAKTSFRNLLIFVFLAVFLFDVLRFSSILFVVPGEIYQDQNVDVVAVLTGGQGRLKEAFFFLESGRAKTLFISGIDEDVSLQDIFKANNISALPDEYPGKIFVDRISKSTRENAVEIKKIAEWLRVSSLLVVTSSYHMRRSMYKIERELARTPSLPIKIYQWPVESPNFDRELWWLSFTGWKILLSEYFKTRADDLFQL